MKIRVNGITIHFEKTGSGKALLLLHGNGEDHHIFDELARKLEKHYTIYSIDSRNHGESEKSGEYSYLTMTEDMLAFIEAIGEETVSLLGFSDGAIIGLMMAIRNQHLFDHLILLGVNLKPTDFKEKAYLSIQKNYEESGDPLLKLMLEEPTISLDDVRDIQVPTLIIAAEKEFFKPETYTDLVEAMPQSTFMLMEGHKHETYINHSAILYPDIVNFIEKKALL